MKTVIKRDYRVHMCGAIGEEEQTACTLFQRYAGSIEEGDPYPMSIAREERLACKYRGKRGDCFYDKKDDA